MHRNSKIFLSYSYSDRDEILDKFINDLDKLPNISLWLAEMELTNGDPVFRDISKAISDCDYFIRIASYRKSNWLDNEMQLAYAEELKNQNLKIITIAFNHYIGNEIINGIGKRGIVIYFGGDYDRGFTELLKYISINSSDNLVSFSLDTSIDKHTIIDISSRINDKLILYFSNNPDKMKVMDRRLFEEFIAEIFYGFGFKVELTQQTRDGGRDIIAIKKEETELKYLIECKRPDPGNIIGVKPVRELFGVKQDEKATKAILATTSFFSKDAIMFFERNKWELESKDFNGIMKWIEDYKRKKNIA
jgi:hypothetical protein